MNRQPTRTDIFEAHEREIYALLAKSIDYRTLVRSYNDLADAIKEMPSRGDLWDKAQQDMYETAKVRAKLVQELAEQASADAETLRQRGIEF